MEETRSRSKERNLFRPMELYWSRYDSDEDDTSNKHDKGNERPGKAANVNKGNVKGKKTKEVKAKIPTKQHGQPTVVDLTPDKSKIESDSNTKKASLKDLCSEDKERIANLIKELARVGEQKQSVQTQLDTERSNFENQILKLIEQQELIVNEREAVQTQLLECQRLLARYQQQILEQQEQLSQSISQAAATPKKKKDSKKIKSTRPASPTRQSYSQEIDMEKFEAGPYQHSNTNLWHNPDVVNQSMSPAHPVANQRMPSAYHVANHSVLSSGAVSDQYITEHVVIPTSNQQPIPLFTRTSGHPQKISSSNVNPATMSYNDRPFTSMIDQMIAQERAEPQIIARPVHHDTGGPNMGSTQQYVSHMANSDEYVVQNRQQNKTMESLGSHGNQPKMEQPFTSGIPLNPEFQSTQKSEYNTENNAGSFRPLQPDSSIMSSAYDGGKCPVAYQNGGTNGAAPSGGGDRQHVEFNSPVYKDIPPDTFQAKADSAKEMTRSLNTQREALLAEQERLKEVLAQQEALLKAKQQQLEDEQTHHRTRLDYFAEKGHFPPTYNQVGQDSVKVGSSDGSYIDDAHQRLKQAQTHVDTEVNKGLPLPRFAEQTQVQTKSAGTLPISSLRTKANIGTSPLRDPPHVGVSNQAVRQDVPKEGPSLRTKAVTGTSASQYDSSMSDSTLDAIRILELTAEMNKHDKKRLYKNSSLSSQSSSTRTRSSASRTPMSDRAAQLLDIVNQVENPQEISLTSSTSDSVPSKGYHPTTRLRSALKGQGSRPQEMRSSGQRLSVSTSETENTADDLEESQLLEDVFFIR